MKQSLWAYGLSAAVLICGGCSHQEPSGLSYQVTDIAMPEGEGGQVGGLDFLPDGRLAACFSSGEVMFYNPKDTAWQLYATGLHDPLGILAESDTAVYVMQRPELTRIVDKDGNGRADAYETVADGFGISGNYHEFAYGPVKDKSGNLYFALNSSSPNGGVMKEVRGPLNKLTMDHPKQFYSPVPYRGWIMQYTSDGKLVPYACGLRSPNGLGFDTSGNLFCTDNQGDWVPTSTLYLVQKGKFYGQPASLVWQKDWKGGNPLKMPVATLDSMRTKAVVLFPQGIMASSPTQPVVDDTHGKFGPFDGQFFVGEMDRPRILRVMLEKIDGQLQGACIPFIDDHGLHKGNNRLAFGPDGSLWVGLNNHGWAGDTGIQRITFSGKTPMEILRMHLTSTGFALTFTQPVTADSALEKTHYSLRHYRYQYSARYGSDQFDVRNVGIQSVQLSKDHQTVSLTLDSLQAGLIYELTLHGITGAHGDTLANTMICYTVNRLNTSN